MLLVGLVLTACGGDDEGEPADEPSETPPTAVAKLSDIPGVVPVVKPGSPQAPETYRTAEITQAEGAPDASAVNVNYESGPDLCAEFTGYAMQETESTIEVTVIVGEQDGCNGKPTLRTTVLNTDEPVGDREVVVSKYSRQSIPIKNPQA